MKLAPAEIDEVLAEHPAVAQALAFAVPHPRWGEDVAAAVVLRPGAAATAREVRQFAARRLAAFKLPSQVYVVESLPSGPTGKPQRRRLVEQLGLTAPAAGGGSEAPRTPFESLLASVTATVLGLARVGRDDNFFLLGGDSLLATKVLARVREATALDVSLERFFAHPTIAELAQLLLSRGLGEMDAGPRPGPFAPPR